MTQIISVLQGERETHKKDGITHDEWLSLFTDLELVALHRAIAHINGDLTWLTDNAVDPDEDATSAGFPGFTYRDLLRRSFKDFDYAPSVSVRDQRTPKALQLLRLFGILKADSRVDTMMLGYPLS